MIKFIYFNISYIFLFTVELLVYCQVDLSKTIIWGPGLGPVEIVLPARYFFVQLVDSNGQNITKRIQGEVTAHIGPLDKKERCRIWTNVLNRGDGTYIIRYKIYQECSGLIIDVRYNDHHLAGFPLRVDDHVLQDTCYCPLKLDTWRHNWHCPDRFKYVEEDLKQFPSVNMDNLRERIIAKFNKRGSMSLCHYVVQKNKIHRQCYGQYVGFHIFMDAILLSITRKAHLPDLEFFVNLGDWPLENKGPNAMPIFSWCGSESTADIVMPTYDITESTLECMGRVQLDMLSVQGNTGPSWQHKQAKAFWRGRDSREERLRLIDIARLHPQLFNASLTNFFFFRDKEEQYGPKQPHVSFFDFFEYKYQICIDGTVAPYRLPYLLAGDSLVLKQDSPYYEHFYRELLPGIHYLPVSRDLTNLVDQIKWAISNDDQSQKIARQGSLYARENLMPTDIFCYHVVLFSEWGKRLSSPVKVLEGMESVSQPEQDTSCKCGHRHTEL